MIKLKSLFTKIDYLILVSLLFIKINSVYAQSTKLVESGKIEFERRENVYSILDNQYIDNTIQGMKEFAVEYKKENPQFKNSDFLLSFSQNKTFYEPVDNKSSSFLAGYAYSNTVLSDLSTHVKSSIKNIFGRDFLLTDSIRNIKWKLTDETREIAGFHCRRANAIIMDSIYVVAFYTDKIVTKGGPESFNGLPGMILGVALPNEHITWFAKTVTVLTDNDKRIPSKLSGKQITKTELFSILNSNSSLQASKKIYNFSIKRILL